MMEKALTLAFIGLGVLYVAAAIAEAVRRLL